jgi:protease-4
MKKSSVLLIVLTAALALGILAGVAIWSLSRINPAALTGAFLEIGGGKVGVVEIKGLISDSKPTLEQLRKFSRDQSIRAIVLRINSPGGAVGPSQEILREVEKIRTRKKVVASLGTVAASGGYYIACGAPVIMASPGTATGSIGVIMNFTNMEQLVKKVGLDIFALKSGSMKDAGSPFRPMTKEDKAFFQHLLDDIHQQFIRDVARNRKLPLEKVRALADGRIWTGEEAKKLGLVDQLGNLYDALDLAGRLAGIKGRVEPVFPEKEGTLWRLLLGQSSEETLSNLLIPSPHPAFLPPWVR